PYRAGQAVVAVVGPGDRLLGVGEPRDAHHRAEHLALDDLVVLARAGDHGGLVEKTRTGALPPARGDLHVAGHLRALDEAGHAAALPVADQRADLHALLVLGAGLDRPHRARQVGHE